MTALFVALLLSLAAVLCLSCAVTAHRGNQRRHAHDYDWMIGKMPKGWR